MTASHDERSGPSRPRSVADSALGLLLRVAGDRAELWGSVDRGVRHSVRLAMPKQKKRIRPRLSLTLDPEIYQRLLAVQSMLPGSSLSGLVGEVLDLGLPFLEGMTEVLKASRTEEGAVDEERARDALAKWAGAQLLALSDTTGDRPGKEK